MNNIAARRKTTVMLTAPGSTAGNFFFFSKFHPMSPRKCYDTRCEEPPAINNENAKILEHKRYFIDREPLRGGNLL